MHNNILLFCIPGRSTSLYFLPLAAGDRDRSEYPWAPCGFGWTPSAPLQSFLVFLVEDSFPTSPRSYNQSRPPLPYSYKEASFSKPRFYFRYLSSISSIGICFFQAVIDLPSKNPVIVMMSKYRYFPASSFTRFLPYRVRLSKAAHKFSFPFQKINQDHNLCNPPLFAVSAYAISRHCFQLMPSFHTPFIL